MKLFVVTMYGAGMNSDDTYVEGIYDNLDKAITAGQSEKDWRRGKYESNIQGFEVNQSVNKYRDKYEAR